MVQVSNEQKIISKWHDKTKKGFLWIIILRLYDQGNPLSGVDIKNKINERVNWEPSPGSIYPMLESLALNCLFPSEMMFLLFVCNLSNFLDIWVKAKRNLRKNLVLCSKISLQKNLMRLKPTLKIFYVGLKILSTNHNHKKNNLC